MHSSTLLTGVCKNMTPLEWKPSASLVISLCSVRVFTLKLHATKKKKKKWARLHKSVFCSVPECLHGLRVVWRLSLMKWVTCNLETTKLLCLHANAAQFTSSPLLSKLEMLECLFNWASNLDWHAKRKKWWKMIVFHLFTLNLTPSRHTPRIPAFFFNSTGWNVINISSERMKFQGCSCGIWLQSKQIKTAWPPSSPLTQHAVSYHFFLTRSLLDLIWRAAALAATWGYRQWIHGKLNRWSKKSKNNVPHSSAWIPNQTVLSNYMEHELNIKICHLM